MKENKINLSSQDNLERSFVGEKWFAYGETEDNYTLFYQEIVKQNGDYLYIEFHNEEGIILNNPCCFHIDDYKKMYPIQEVFNKPMSLEDAKDILRQLFF